MRRVRSQLNNLAPSAPGGYPANQAIQPSVGFNRQTDEIQRRIDTMGLQPHGDPSMPVMYAHSNHPGDYQHPPYPQPMPYPQYVQPQMQVAPQANPELDNIKSSLERLTNKLQGLVKDAAESNARSQNAPAAENLGSGEGINALRLAMEADHNAIIEELRKNNSGIDPVAYARTVETSHSEVIRQIAELEKSLSANHSRSDGLADAIKDSHRDIADLIRDVKTELGRQEIDTADGSSNATEEMRMRLEELTRAVMALTSRESAVDNLERIEARIGDLQKLVDPDDQNAKTVSEQIHEVIGLLGQMDANITSLGPRNESGLDGLAAKINRLSEKIDNIGAIANGGESDENPALLERLDTLVQRVENIRQEPADPAMLHSIESQINKLSEQIEVLGNTSPVTSTPGTMDFEPLLERLNQIEVSINDTVGTMQADGIYASLEQHLSAIAGRLDSLENGAPISLEPLEQRLSGIEDQLGASRDIAIELATQAAQEAVQRAVEAIPQAPANVETVDAATIHMLAEDLKILNERTATMGVGNGDLETVRLTLESIATRLNHIEVSSRSGQALPQSPQEQPSVEELAPPERDHDFSETQGPHHENPAPASLPDVEPPSLEMAEAPVVPEEDNAHGADMPLEPGTGTPDLAALVRQANKRRINEDGEEPVSSGTDFIAAARRAAQAAAAEANLVEEDAADKSASGKTSALGALLKRRKKVIVMAAAVALMVALAAPYAGQLIGNVKNRIAGTSAVEPAAIEQSMSDSDSGDDVIREVTSESVESIPGREADLADDGTETSVAPPDTEVAETIPSQSPSQQNSTDGQVVNADQITFGSDLFKQAVRNGDPIAMFEVARHYTDGIDVNKDLTEAARWYEKSAALGFAPAQYLIGNFNEKGIGVDQNNQNAASWYTMAAENGNVVAMHNLAVMHASPGKLSDQPDMATAFKWFSQAAEHGVRDSQVNAGIFYTNGAGPNGVDLVEAYKWFAIAAKAGDSDAASKRDIVANAMRPDQLEKARAEAELWRPTEPNPAANDVKVPEEWKSGAAAGAMVSDNESVRKVQTMLAKLGFDPGPADGVMGQKTRQAIAAFQKRAGLSVNGQIDPELMEALKAVSI